MLPATIMMVLWMVMIFLLLVFLPYHQLDAFQHNNNLHPRPTAASTKMMTVSSSSSSPSAAASASSTTTTTMMMIEGTTTTVDTDDNGNHHHHHVGKSRRDVLLVTSVFGMVGSMFVFGGGNANAVQKLDRVASDATWDGIPLSESQSITADNLMSKLMMGDSTPSSSTNSTKMTTVKK